jgi:hypothetical protein
MGKQPTEKQLAARKAFGEAAKARAAERKAKKQANSSEPVVNTTKTETPTPVAHPSANTDGDDEVNQESYDDLKRQIDELKSYLFDKKPQTQPENSLGVNNQGGLIGSIEKYLVDPANYPSPVERLMKEARLAPFAFDVNYEIDYEIHTTKYQNKDGVNMREPRFELELRKIMLDDNGVPTDKRIIARRMVFHEDPQAAITIARENGVDVDEQNERDFLNEMRYLRTRDWLLDIFYPKPAQKARDTRYEVIDGQQVQVITVNSEEPQGNFFTGFKRA